MLSPSHTARFGAVAGAAIVTFGAFSPWLTYLGPFPPHEMSPFHPSDVLVGALLVAALVLADGLSRHRTRGAIAVGAGLLLTVLAELRIVNGLVAASEAPPGNALVPGKVFNAGYYLVVVSAGLLVLGGLSEWRTERSGERTRASRGSDPA